jgi:hypothetical protein
MCVQAIPVWIYYAATAASAVVGYMGSQNSAAAASNQARYNAEVATQQAQVAGEQRPGIMEDADLERRRLADRYGQVVSDAQAGFAAQGFDASTGTPYAVVQASRQAYDIDKSIISANERDSLRANDLEGHGLLTQAELLRREARYSKKAGNLEAWGSLLTGASRVADRWQQSNPGGG